MSGLSFYMHDGPKTFRFELAGALAGVEVARLRPGVADGVVNLRREDAGGGCDVFDHGR